MQNRSSMQTLKGWERVEDAGAQEKKKCSAAQSTAIVRFITHTCTHRIPCPPPPATSTTSTRQRTTAIKSTVSPPALHTLLARFSPCYTYTFAVESGVLDDSEPDPGTAFYRKIHERVMSHGRKK